MISLTTRDEWAWVWFWAIGNSKITDIIPCHHNQAVSLLRLRWLESVMNIGSFRINGLTIWRYSNEQREDPLNITREIVLENPMVRKEIIHAGIDIIIINYGVLFIRLLRSKLLYLSLQLSLFRMTMNRRFAFLPCYRKRR